MHNCQTGAARLRIFALLGMLAFNVAPAAAETCIDGFAASQREVYGQLVMVGFRGTKPSDPGVKQAFRYLEQGYVGGLLFFGHNIKSKKQLKRLTGYFKSAKAKWPPFLAVDEEGGRVQRLRKSKGFRDEPTAQSLGEGGKVATAKSIYSRMAAEISASGLNLNFAPVVDVNLNRKNPIIGGIGRSFNADPKKVVTFARTFIKAHHGKSVVTALKHWPGHGSSRKDTHKQFVDVTGIWNASEREPYKMLIKANMVDMIMSGHLYHAAWGGKDRRPASLSRDAIDRNLRQNLDYKGVVITDDLQMKAITSRRTLGDAIVQALNAGNDIALIGNTLAHKKDLAKFAVRTIADAVKAEKLSDLSLRCSYVRVTKLKKKWLLK